MFSQEFYHVFGRHITLSTFLGGSPFVWNTKLKSFSVNELSHIWFALNALALYGAGIYAGGRSLYLKFYGDMSDLGFVMALFMAAVFDAIGYTMMLLNPHHLASVVNASLRYYTTFCSKCIFLNIFG